ncbi:hypothetical protein EVJ58_g10434 [Rhodofomes roseus]|uniref:Zinc finger PHD-type domain-containing protein n=1 Tax=Rhodofomes roseus TaxID=34475 RepID=A0A4Y9XR78_9APHY|nr:hypothetical protein EVJ58_g10434 [Rhodofomes roseus]
MPSQYASTTGTIILNGEGREAVQSRLLLWVRDGLSPLPRHEREGEDREQPEQPEQPGALLFKHTLPERIDDYKDQELSNRQADDADHGGLPVYSTAQGVDRGVSERQNGDIDFNNTVLDPAHDRQDYLLPGQLDGGNNHEDVLENSAARSADHQPLEQHDSLASEREVLVQSDGEQQGPSFQRLDTAGAGDGEHGELSKPPLGGMDYEGAFSDPVARDEDHELELLGALVDDYVPSDRADDGGGPSQRADGAEYEDTVGNGKHSELSRQPVDGEDNESAFSDYESAFSDPEARDEARELELPGVLAEEYAPSDRAADSGDQGPSPRRADGADYDALMFDSVREREHGELSRQPVDGVDYESVFVGPVARGEDHEPEQPGTPPGEYVQSDRADGGGDQGSFPWRVDGTDYEALMFDSVGDSEHGELSRQPVDGVDYESTFVDPVAHGEDHESEQPGTPAGEYVSSDRADGGGDQGSFPWRVDGTDYEALMFDPVGDSEHGELSRQPVDGVDYESAFMDPAARGEGNELFEQPGALTFHASSVLSNDREEHRLSGQRATGVHYENMFSDPLPQGGAQKAFDPYESSYFSSPGAGEDYDMSATSGSQPDHGTAVADITPGSEASGQPGWWRDHDDMTGKHSPSGPVVKAAEDRATSGHFADRADPEYVSMLETHATQGGQEVFQLRSDHGDSESVSLDSAGDEWEHKPSRWFGGGTEHYDAAVHTAVDGKEDQSSEPIVSLLAIPHIEHAISPSSGTVGKPLFRSSRSAGLDEYPHLSVICRCGLRGVHHTSSVDLDMVKCSLCSCWSHVACQRNGRASMLRSTDEFVCDSCTGDGLLPARESASSQRTKAHAFSHRKSIRNNVSHLPMANRLLAGKGALARYGKFWYPVRLLQFQDKPVRSWRVAWWRHCLFPDHIGRPSSDAPVREMDLVDELWNDRTARRSIRLGKWKLACRLQEEDSLADPMSYPFSPEIDQALSPHIDVLTTLVHDSEPDPDAQYPEIPALDAVRIAKSKARESAALKAGVIADRGNATVADFGRIINWVYTQIPGAKDTMHTWLGRVPTAHAVTLLILSRYRSEFTRHPIFALKVTDSEKDQYLLRQAWMRQLLDVNEEGMICDVDQECLCSFEQRLFAWSPDASASCHEQWGLDAGDHQEKWFPYQGLPPEWGGPGTDGNDSDFTKGSNYSSGEEDPEIAASKKKVIVRPRPRRLAASGRVNSLVITPETRSEQVYHQEGGFKDTK